MKQYLNLLEDILENGRGKDDRTGTGTRSVFGRQLRFNLEDGFPLLTTKKIFWKAIVHELLWFLKGDTNIKYLNDNGVHIWDDWATDDGELGPVYSVPWRKWYCYSNDIVAVDKALYRFDEEYVPTFNNKEYEYIKSDIDGFNRDGFVVLGRIPNSGSNSKYVIKFHSNGYISTANKGQIKEDSKLKNPYDLNQYGCCVGEPKGFDSRKSTHKKIRTMWENMVYRCYKKDHPQYPQYGGMEIFIKSSWKCFENFFNTISQVVGFHEWVSNPSEYQLDKDYYGANYYSKKSCVFLPNEYNKSLLTSSSEHIKLGVKWLLTNTNTNEIFEDTHINKLLSEHNISVDYNYFKSHNHKYKNYVLERVLPYGGELFRRRIFTDQIQYIINELLHNPTNRRLIVSGWNPSILPDTSLSPKENAANGKQALPPCHTLFQFIAEPLTLEERLVIADHPYTETFGKMEYIIAMMDNEGIPKYKLSCQMYQRSADVFLGVPFNIASYALLTHIIAYIVGMQPGDFIHTFGDVHIYNNHFDQIKEQLSRTPKKLPTLKIKDRRKFKLSVAPEDFVFDDFELIDYDPYPLIKGNISV